MKINNISEWYFTGEAIDNKERICSCDLCDTSIRYVYIIENKYTREKGGVGSDCIELFEVKMIKNGVGHSLEDTLKEVNKLKYHLKKTNDCDYVLETINKLGWPNINYYKEIYLDIGYFKPQEAFSLFYHLDKRKFVYNKSKFKLKFDIKKDLEGFTYSKFKQIEKALTNKQKIECKKYLFEN